MIIYSINLIIIGIEVDLTAGGILAAFAWLSRLCETDPSGLLLNGERQAALQFSFYAFCLSYYNRGNRILIC